MANVAPSRIATVLDRIQAWKWAGLTENDTALPAQVPGRNDKTVQVVKQSGGAFQVDVEGALDPDSPTYATLNDPQGNALNITDDRIETVLENVILLKPNISVGTGVSVDVYLLAR